jgi:hypothetical protein
MSKVIFTPEDNESRPLPAIFPGVSQRVAVGGSSTQSAAFGDSTGMIRLAPTTDCYVAFGLNPTATNASLFLPAGSIEYFGVSPGEKIACLQVSSAGFLNVVEAK